MIDGIDYRDHSILVAMGIDSSGKKHVLGVREGTTENSSVAGALLSDLVDRGLVTDHPLLFVIDGGKALRKAIRRVFGEFGVVQRCQVHKMRNVLEHHYKHEIVEILKRTREAMTEGGRVFIQVPNAETPFGARLRYADFSHEVAFTSSSISQVLRVCGFVEIETGPIRTGARGLRRFVWRLTELLYKSLLRAELGKQVCEEAVSKAAKIIREVETRRRKKK